MSPSRSDPAPRPRIRALEISGSAADPRVLILGFGNPGRQDDGLGPAVAAEIEALGWSNVTVHDNYQLNIEDAFDVAQHDVVWFVDAAKNGPSPFVIEAVSPSATLEFTSHLVSPQAILAMAYRYYGAAPRAFLLGVRGFEFEFVEALTPAAADNLWLAVEMLKDRLRTPRSLAMA